jgi:PQQ-like domain
MYIKMKPKTSVSTFLIIISFFLGSLLTVTFAQNVFFKTNAVFGAWSMKPFYSSFAIDSNQIYFNQTDHTLTSYDKKTGNLLWSYNNFLKSNNPPKVNHNSVFINRYFEDESKTCMQLNKKTGDTIHRLSIQTPLQNVLFKGDTLFCAAISPESGGLILAYDLIKNEIIWEHFIAHGVEKQPYFLRDRIVANAEQENWFDVTYDGKIDTSCNEKTYIFADNIKCSYNFQLLTHNNKTFHLFYADENNEHDFDLNAEYEISYAPSKTFMLHKGKLLMIDDNAAIEKAIEIDSLIEFPETEIYYHSEILKSTATTVSFVYNAHYIDYDYINQKVLKTLDLTSWEIHQAILEDNKLWIISRKDGQLYGLDLEPELKKNIPKKK